MISDSLISESPISSSGIFIKFTATSTIGILQFVGISGISTSVGLSIGALEGTYEVLGSFLIPEIGHHVVVRSSSLFMEGQVAILVLDESLLPTEDFKLEHVTGNQYKVI